MRRWPVPTWEAEKPIIVLIMSHDVERIGVGAYDFDVVSEKTSNFDNRLLPRSTNGRSSLCLVS